MSSTNSTSTSTNPLFPYYTPSFDLALACTVIVFAMMIIHGYLAYKTKAKYFGMVVKVALMWVIGMILRLVVIDNGTLTGVYAASSALLQVPGSLLTIIVIFTYTRLMWWRTPNEKRNIGTLWLPPRYTSICIGGAQMLSDTVATLGSGQFFKSPSPHIQAIGAVLEMIVWMFFPVVVIRFTFISRRWRTPPEVDRLAAFELGLALSACALTFPIRGVFQVLEKDAQQALSTTGKPSSIITTEEWPTWAFNYLPSLFVLIITAIYYPGFYLPPRLKSTIRLRTKKLEQEKLAEEEGAASNGWVISTPIPCNSEENDRKPEHIVFAEEEIGMSAIGR